ncbi:hypothetical protein, partial [Fredinandcohnia sp. 179-A 10B2 NHS]|uniref:hypothetical protein n=1 Tax=Fredinandcohnia sp. 179-A 10B2 NHS TaxID=3235176 RepID=UPI0039A3778E
APRGRFTPPAAATASSSGFQRLSGLSKALALFLFKKYALIFTKIVCFSFLRTCFKTFIKFCHILQ